VGSFQRRHKRNRNISNKIGLLESGKGKAGGGKAVGGPTLISNN